MEIEPRIRTYVDQTARALRSSLSESQLEVIAEEAQALSRSVDLPSPGESLAVSYDRPKTTALAFDRVHAGTQFVPDAILPKGIGFFCGTDFEMRLLVFSLVHTIGTFVKATLGTAEEVEELPRTAGGVILIGLPPELTDRPVLRRLGAALAQRLGTTPTIAYATTPQLDSEFPPGPQAVLATAIAQLQLVDEHALSWEQVTEFRADKEARRKYRRLIRWIDREMRNAKPSDIVGLMEDRLEDYERSLKKHGILTKLGALECLVDPRFLGGLGALLGGAALAGGGPWAAAAGAAVTVGQSLLSLTRKHIEGLDEQRKGNVEIAYVHDVQQRLGGTK